MDSNSMKFSRNVRLPVLFRFEPLDSAKIAMIAERISSAVIKTMKKIASMRISSTINLIIRVMLDILIELIYICRAFPIVFVVSLCLAPLLLWIYLLYYIAARSISYLFFRSTTARNIVYLDDPSHPPSMLTSNIPCIGETASLLMTKGRFFTRRMRRCNSNVFLASLCLNQLFPSTSNLQIPWNLGLATQCLVVISDNFPYIPTKKGKYEANIYFKLLDKALEMTPTTVEEEVISQMNVFFESCCFEDTFSFTDKASKLCADMILYIFLATPTGSHELQQDFETYMRISKLLASSRLSASSRASLHQQKMKCKRVLKYAIHVALERARRKHAKWIAHEFGAGLPSTQYDEECFDYPTTSSFYLDELIRYQKHQLQMSNREEGNIDSSNEERPEEERMMEGGGSLDCLEQQRRRQVDDDMDEEDHFLQFLTFLYKHLFAQLHRLLFYIIISSQATSHQYESSPVSSRCQESLKRVFETYTSYMSYHSLAVNGHENPNEDFRFLGFLINERKEKEKKRRQGQEQRRRKQQHTIEGEVSDADTDSLPSSPSRSPPPIPTPPPSPTATTLSQQQSPIIPPNFFSLEQLRSRLLGDPAQRLRHSFTSSLSIIFNGSDSDKQTSPLISKNIPPHTFPRSSITSNPSSPSSPSQFFYQPSLESQSFALKETIAYSYSQSVANFVFPVRQELQEEAALKKKLRKIKEDEEADAEAGRNIIRYIKSTLRASSGVEAPMPDMILSSIPPGEVNTIINDNDVRFSIPRSCKVKIKVLLSECEDPPPSSSCPPHRAVCTFIDLICSTFTHLLITNYSFQYVGSMDEYRSGGKGSLAGVKKENLALRVTSFKSVHDNS